MASGHGTALTGRTHGCTDQACDVKISLANSEPSTHGTKLPKPMRRVCPLLAIADSRDYRNRQPLLTSSRHEAGRTSRCSSVLPLSVQSRGEVGWIISEATCLVCPSLTDVLVGREAAESLQPLGEVVGIQESSEMVLELPVVFVMIPPDGCFLEGAVHPLDLSVGPRVVGLGQAMFDPMLPADAVEPMHPPACSRP